MPLVAKILKYFFKDKPFINRLNKYIDINKKVLIKSDNHVHEQLMPYVLEEVKVQSQWLYNEVNKYCDTDKVITLTTIEAVMTRNKITLSKETDTGLDLLLLNNHSCGYDIAKIHYDTVTEALQKIDTDAPQIAEKFAKAIIIALLKEIYIKETVTKKTKFIEYYRNEVYEQIRSHKDYPRLLKAKKHIDTITNKGIAYFTTPCVLFLFATGVKCKELEYRFGLFLGEHEGYEPKDVADEIIKRVDEALTIHY